eukprot:CAMPEP_0197023788 /NCGR_PEP_ID=MMETSP1384-20130603/4422_1 /TAXON_ID=29189 /ORGANISM="Ammonia sp." /LENGTH=1466 /DNA_ID=CAMNT_0042452053 /DNA_START=42 /DNA_END=4442 /DNA_ORIENTATION=+
MSQWMNARLWWILLAAHILCNTNVNGSANASNTEITTPVSGLPLNSSILDTSRSTFIITAVDSLGGLAGDSELFFVELNSEGTCEVGYGSTSCQVLCYPYTAPHTAAKQCESSLHHIPRVSKTASTALWVIADVEPSGSSTYTVSYYGSVEVSDYYIVSAYLLTNGGLYGRYWDNIWFTGTESYSEIASEINKHWGTDTPITQYGTDYISVRWEGKILAPYNETYKFYLYADDGARLWIDKQLIIDGWDECCNETWGSVNLTSYAFHDIIVEYREIRYDAYIELRWSSDSIAKSIVPSTYLYYQTDIKNSPFSDNAILISPGNVSYEQTVVNDIAPFSNNIAGQNNSVYLTATDAFGHVLNTDTAAFNMTNLDGMTTLQEWIGNGIYKITYMSYTKTADNVGVLFSIKLNDNHILNSPYTVHIEPASTSPSNSTLSGTGLVSAVAGYSAKFNITLYDVYGNERESDGDDILIRFYGAAAGHGTAQYVTEGRGMYLVTYTLTKVGIYTPEITVNDVVLSYSQSINVTAGTIHGPSCDIMNAEQLNTTLKAGYFEYLTIQSRDQFGNALSSTADEYVVNISDGIHTINASVQSIGDGQYNVSFQPIAVGEYDVNIKLNNLSHILNSPYTLTVIPGDVSASTSSVLSSGDGNGHISAESNVETYFIVQLRDAYSNALQQELQTQVFDLKVLSCASLNVTLSCSYYVSGQYNCSYTPIESGACSLSLTISGIHIADSPFSVSVSPGRVSASNSYAYNIADGTAGVIQSFRIQSQDLNGNNLTVGGNTFIAKLIDKHSIYDEVVAEITDNTDGTYTVNYVTPIANVYEALAVQLLNVGGLLANYYTDYSFTNLYSTYGKNVIDPQIAFDWGHNQPLPSGNGDFPASDYFSIRWTGYLYPPYSETYTIYTSIYGGSGVRLYINNDLLIDQFDPLDGAADPFIIIQLTANTLYDVQIDFREHTGECKLWLEWQSASIPRQPISSQYLYYQKSIAGDAYTANVSIVPSSTLAGACSVSGDGLSTAIAGYTTILSIVAKDSYGNIQSDAGNEETDFSLYLLDAQGNRINGSVVDSGNNGLDGQYTASYVISNTSQQYTLYLTYKGANVASSPYTVSVLPGNLSMTTSSAVLSDGRAGESQTFSLYLRDDHSNLIDDDRTISISILLTHSATGTTITTSDIVDHETGVYTITYNATLSGEFTPSITINGLSLITLTSAINISEAIASSSKSYIRGWSSGAVGTIPSGVEIQKVIQLVDIYSNLISVTGGYHFYVTLQNSSEHVVEQALIIPADNGSYFVNFTAPSAGTYYLSVYLASGDINSADGLTGEYFNNRWLYGTPYNTQIDGNISLDWGHGLVTATAKNFVSVRWSGYIKPAYAETYNFSISSDDGSRLYIDNELIFDHFLSDAATFSGTHTFGVADLLYPISIEYRENTGNANITLDWESASQSAQTIPQSVLFSSAAHIQSSPFTLTVT